MKKKERERERREEVRNRGEEEDMAEGSGKRGMERIVCEWICAYNGARESKSGELIVARAADEAAAICGA